MFLSENIPNSRSREVEFKQAYLKELQLEQNELREKEAIEQFEEYIASIREFLPLSLELPAIILPTVDLLAIGLGDDGDDQLGCPMQEEDEEGVARNLEFEGLLKNEVIVSVSCGSTFSFGLTSQGGVYSWGLDDSTGHDEETEVLQPTRIVFPNDFKGACDVVCGEMNAACLDRSGQVWWYVVSI